MRNFKATRLIASLWLVCGAFAVGTVGTACNTGSKEKPARMQDKKAPKKSATKKVIPSVEADFEVDAARAITKDNYRQALTDLETQILEEQKVVLAAKAEKKGDAQAQAANETETAAAKEKATSSAGKDADKAAVDPQTKQEALKPATPPAAARKAGAAKEQPATAAKAEPLKQPAKEPVMAPVAPAK